MNRKALFGMSEFGMPSHGFGLRLLPEEASEASGGGGGKPEAKPAAYVPPATQQEFDERTEARLAALRRQVDERYADYGELKKKAADFDKAAAEAMSEHEKALVKAREEGAAEVRTATDVRLINAEAKALAAEAGFRNPQIAIKAINLSAIKVNAAGDADTKAIQAALVQLAADEPYLIDDGKTRRPRPDSHQGAKPDGTPAGSDAGSAEARKRFGDKAPAFQL